MSKFLGQIHHLIRYFFVLGVISFVAYVKRWSDAVSLFIMGPPLYLSHGLKKILKDYVNLPDTQTINYYAFLLPITVIYFSLMGFQLKQLWNETGKIRFISLFALIAFIAYIHYKAWGNLSAYFAIPY